MQEEHCNYHCAAAGVQSSSSEQQQQQQQQHCKHHRAAYVLHISLRWPHLRHHPYSKNRLDRGLLLVPDTCFSTLFCPKGLRHHHRDCASDSGGDGVENLLILVNKKKT